MSNKIKTSFLSMLLPILMLPAGSTFAENYVMRFQMDGVKESGITQEEVKKKEWEKFMEGNKTISDYTLDYTYNNFVFQGNLLKTYPSINFPNSELSGSLAIYRSNISNVDPFITVNRVGRSLVFNNNKLNNIDGFGNIQYVGNYISLAENNLENLNGLKNLRKVVGDFNARSNQIKDLDGLRNLRTVNGFMFLYDNKIENIDGLINLQYVGGELNMGTNYIQNLKGLKNLEYIGGNLAMTKNPYLTDISGLSGLKYIGGSVDLNSSIHMREGFKGIDSDSWICQPEQINKFKSSGAQQKDICI